MLLSSGFFCVMFVNVSYVEKKSIDFYLTILYNYKSRMEFLGPFLCISWKKMENPSARSNYRSFCSDFGRAVVS